MMGFVNVIFTKERTKKLI